MLGRLFFGIHWVMFLIFAGLWLMAFSGLIFLDITLAKLLSNFLEAVLFEDRIIDAMVIGLMTWIPIVFLFIDYVVHGKWTWFPWERNKE